MPLAPRRALRCCSSTRYCDLHYEPQRVACVVRAAAARDQFHIGAADAHPHQQLGGHRGAEAEGDVMAWFVALATAADAKLLERSSGLDEDPASTRSAQTPCGRQRDAIHAALDRAGFAEMHLPAFCSRRVDDRRSHVSTQVVGHEQHLRRVGRAGPVDSTGATASS